MHLLTSESSSPNGITEVVSKSVNPLQVRRQVEEPDFYPQCYVTFLNVYLNTFPVKSSLLSMLITKHSRAGHQGEN
jgi:hypothetical protein